MVWAPVEYRECCGRVRGVWTVLGMAKCLDHGHTAVCSLRETWPAGESPQSQPARTHWFRDRLFAVYQRHCTRASGG